MAVRAEAEVDDVKHLWRTGNVQESPGDLAEWANACAFRQTRVIPHYLDAATHGRDETCSVSALHSCQKGGGCGRGPKQ